MYDFLGYFITLCTHRRKNIFGTTLSEGSDLNDFGKLVANVWKELTENIPEFIVDEFVVMPDHIHGILLLNYERTQRSAPPFLLSNTSRRFKTFTTYKYVQMKNEKNEAIEGKLWQRGFYEKTIRHEKDLIRVREYIRNNKCGGADL